MTDATETAGWREADKGHRWSYLHDLHALSEVGQWQGWSAQVLCGDDRDQVVLRFTRGGDEIEVRWSHPSLADQLERKYERGMRSAILDAMFPEVGLYRGHEEIRPPCTECGAVNAGNVDCAACVQVWPISEESKAALLSAIEAREITP